MGGTHSWPGGSGGVGGGGGVCWPCMAALSLCLFDIWQKRAARMKERAQKRGKEKKRVKG